MRKRRTPVSYLGVLLTKVEYTKISQGCYVVHGFDVTEMKFGRPRRWEITLKGRRVNYFYTLTGAIEWIIDNRESA